DLLFGERTDFSTIAGNIAEQSSVLAERHHQQCTGAGEFDSLPLQTSKFRGAVSCSRRQIDDVDVLPPQQLLPEMSGHEGEPTAHVFCEAFRHSARRNRAEPFPVIRHKRAACGTTKSVRVLQDCIKYWRDVAGRGVDDPQYLGGGSLSSQRIVTLG